MSKRIKGPIGNLNTSSLYLTENAGTSKLVSFSTNTMSEHSKDAGISSRGKTCAKADAEDGTRGHFSQEKDLYPGGGNREISVSAPWGSHLPTESGVEHRPDLYKAVKGFCLPGGDYRLVFALRAVMGTVKLGRCLLLSGCA